MSLDVIRCHWYIDVYSHYTVIRFFLNKGDPKPVVSCFNHVSIILGPLHLRQRSTKPSHPFWGTSGLNHVVVEAPKLRDPGHVYNMSPVTRIDRQLPYRYIYINIY